jgi:hypothetical protein
MRHIKELIFYTHLKKLGTNPIKHAVTILQRTKDICDSMQRFFYSIESS